MTVNDNTMTTIPTTIQKIPASFRYLIVCSVISVLTPLTEFDQRTIDFAKFLDCWSNPIVIKSIPMGSKISLV